MQDHLPGRQETMVRPYTPTTHPQVPSPGVISEMMIERNVIHIIVKSMTAGYTFPTDITTDPTKHSTNTVKNRKNVPPVYTMHTPNA
jgi:hypothetical protein